MARLGTGTLGEKVFGTAFTDAIATTVSIQPQQSANEFSASQSGLGPIDAQTALDGTGLSQQRDGTIANASFAQFSKENVSTTVSNAIVSSQVSLLLEATRILASSNDNSVESLAFESADVFTSTDNADLTLSVDPSLSNDQFTQLTATGGLVPMIHMEFSSLFTEFRTRNNITSVTSEENIGVTSNIASANRNVVSGAFSESVAPISATDSLGDSVSIIGQTIGNEKPAAIDGDTLIVNISNTTLGQSRFGTRRFNDTNIFTGIGFPASFDAPQPLSVNVETDSNQFTRRLLLDNILESNALTLTENLFTTASAASDLIFDSKIVIENEISATTSLENVLQSITTVSFDTFTVASDGDVAPADSIIDGVGFSQVFDKNNDIFVSSDELGQGFAQVFDGELVSLTSDPFGIGISGQFVTPGVENVFANTFGFEKSGTTDGRLVTVTNSLAEADTFVIASDGVIVPVISQQFGQPRTSTDVTGGLVPMIHMEFSSLFTSFRTRNNFVRLDSTVRTSNEIIGTFVEQNTVDTSTFVFDIDEVPTGSFDGGLVFVNQPDRRLGEDEFGNDRFSPSPILTGFASNRSQRVGEKPTVSTAELSDVFTIRSAVGDLFVNDATVIGNGKSIVNVIGSNPLVTTQIFGNAISRGIGGFILVSKFDVFTADASNTSQRPGQKPLVSTAELADVFATGSAGKIISPESAVLGNGKSIVNSLGTQPLANAFESPATAITGVFETPETIEINLSVDIANAFNLSSSTPGPFTAFTFPLVGSLVTGWTLGTTILGTTVEETREYETLELTIRYRKSEKQQIIRQILDTSQKSQILSRSGGGFKTVDTGDNTNALNLRAPATRSNLRSVDEWYLADYERELVDRDGEVYNLDLELNPTKNKAYDNEYGTFDSAPTEPIDEAVWNFEFEFGNFNTRQVSVNYNESPSGTLETNEITMILSEEEARIVEENASQLNTVRARTVPDSTDVIDDTSVDERHTVSISPPGNNDEPIPQDEYVIRSWSTEWSGKVFEVTMEVSK